MSQALTSEVWVSTNGLKLETILEILKVSVSGDLGDGAEGGVGAGAVVVVEDKTVDGVGLECELFSEPKTGAEGGVGAIGGAGAVAGSGLRGEPFSEEIFSEAVTSTVVG